MVRFNEFEVIDDEDRSGDVDMQINSCYVGVVFHNVLVVTIIMSVNYTLLIIL